MQAAPGIDAVRKPRNRLRPWLCRGLSDRMRATMLRAAVRSRLTLGKKHERFGFHTEQRADFDRDGYVMIRGLFRSCAARNKTLHHAPSPLLHAAVESIRFGDQGSRTEVCHRNAGSVHEHLQQSARTQEENRLNLSPGTRARGASAASTPASGLRAAAVRFALTRAYGRG